MPSNEVNFQREIEKETKKTKQKKSLFRPPKFFEFQISVISKEAFSFQLCLREVGLWAL